MHFEGCTQHAGAATDPLGERCIRNSDKGEDATVASCLFPVGFLGRVFVTIALRQGCLCGGPHGRVPLRVPVHRDRLVEGSAPSEPNRNHGGGGVLPECACPPPHGPRLPLPRFPSAGADCTAPAILQARTYRLFNLFTSPKYNTELPQIWSTLFRNYTVQCLPPAPPFRRLEAHRIVLSPCCGRARRTCRMEQRFAGVG